jgi:hypothetical protein
LLKISQRFWIKVGSVVLMRAVLGCNNLLSKALVELGLRAKGK